MSAIPLESSQRSGFPVWHWACGAHRPCEHWDGERHCGAPPTHMYISGARCDPHKPGALRTSRETSPTRKEAA